MKDKIKEIILQYCDGSYMKRFAYDDLDNMVNRIITTTEVKENDFIDGVVNCDDIDHNLYINYDGDCGACGGSVKK